MFHITCTLPFRDLMYATGLYSQEDERKIEKKAFLFRSSENLLGYSLNFCKKNTIIIVIYKIPKKEKFLKFLILDKKQKRKKEAIMHPSFSTPLIMVIELIGEQMEMESKWTTESKSDCKDHQWFLNGCYKNIIYCTC